MNPTQPELQFEPVIPAQEPHSRLAELIHVLQACGTWITARKLKEAGFTERELREIVESDSDGYIFSFPGSPGYKLFTLVTDAEFDHCISLRNQGKKMVRRWVNYQRRWHKRNHRA